MAADPCNVTFFPTNLDGLIQDTVGQVNVSLLCNNIGTLSYSLQVDDRSIADITGSNHIVFNTEPYLPTEANFSVSGLELGRTNIRFTQTNLVSSGALSSVHISDYPLSVVRQTTSLDTIYFVVLGAMIVLYNLGFGCKIRLSEIWTILKRPIGPAVGAFCQFGIMAPLAFGVAKLCGLSNVLGLGLLAIGSCPGGGGSNVFAYLLDADLELSITMTFISTLLALGMTPLWIWGLGRYFTEGDTGVHIPVANVFGSLASVVIPVALGVLLNWWKPRVGSFISKCLKPFSAVIGIVFVAMGVYVYYYAMIRVTSRLLISCAALSGCGYIIGFSAGCIIVRDKRKAVTISLETGFQNLALSLFVLGLSLPAPESQLAGVIPIWYTFISSGYPILAFIIYRIILAFPRKLPDDARDDHLAEVDDSLGNGEIGPADEGEELDYPWVVKVDESNAHCTVEA